MKKQFLYFVIIFITLLLNCDSIFSDHSDENESLKKALKQAKINALKIEIARLPSKSDSLQAVLNETIKMPWVFMTIPDTITATFSRESLSKQRSVVGNDTIYYYWYSGSKSGPFYYITGSFKDIDDIESGYYKWFFYMVLEHYPIGKKRNGCVYLFDIE